MVRFGGNATTVRTRRRVLRACEIVYWRAEGIVVGARWRVCKGVDSRNHLRSHREKAILQREKERWKEHNLKAKNQMLTRDRSDMSHHIMTKGPSASETCFPS